MGEVRSMMVQFLEQMKQEKNENKTPAENENKSDDTTATPARRSLRYEEEIPELTSPLTAIKRSAVKSSTAGVSDNNIAPQLVLPLPTASSSVGNSDANVALQKGMAKPPVFTGTNTDNLRTWWRQIKNFVSAFPSEVRSQVIKSYLRGAAATWLESQERNMGRSLTLEELADGLVQEYGSEITSAAALLKIESLSMNISEGCDTVAGYNAQFSELYNELLSPREQIAAIRSYIKGVAPRYLKYIVYNGTNFTTLAGAKAAVTDAVAKHDQLELAYANHQQQKKGRNRNTRNFQRGGSNQSRRDNENKKTSNNQNNNNRIYKNRSWEDQNPYRYALSSLADTALEDEDDYDNNGSEAETESKDHQLAAVAAVNKDGKADDKRNGKSSNEQLAKLRREGRCFGCGERGHRKFECKKGKAAIGSKPLNG